MAVKANKEHFIKQLYDDIKAEVVGHKFQVGKRINVEHLAERKRVSTTPVREILNGLVAEKLIVTEPKLGFFMKGLSEVELRDIYFANQQILGWCLSKVKLTFGSNGLLRFPAMKDDLNVLLQADTLSSNQLAVLTGKMFLHFAKQANNGEFISQIASFNDRLVYIRTWECDLLNQPRKMLEQIHNAYAAKDFDAVSDLLASYHESRLALSSTLIGTVDMSANEADSIYR